jgi:hypothetical protein
VRTSFTDGLFDLFDVDEGGFLSFEEFIALCVMFAMYNGDELQMFW